MFNNGPQLRSATLTPEFPETPFIFSFNSPAKISPLILKSLFLFPLVLLCAGVVLSDHIRHFEPLFFNHHSFRDQHHRSKRSPKLDIRLEFAAHNRLFKLRMKRDTSVFSPDVAFESSSRGPISYDTSNVLKGYIEEDEESSVEGLITTDGLFDGVISVHSGEEFFVEPASRYFDEPQDFHSVMYKGSDVQFPTNQSYCHVPKPSCDNDHVPARMSDGSGRREDDRDSRRERRPVEHRHQWRSGRRLAPKEAAKATERRWRPGKPYLRLLENWLA
ncbi:hypothetical protein HPB48_012367 [Haemaphysalis longicornis]|uniref:Uncharacterized protein n=1 Tax=Haemaphysalis longicornis TaxID=44386 RepID=A0A9J6G2J3_HAELO|nr:hypothetical protein HPB48_012367 [Haemaphysalis longicornis]